MSQKYLNAVLDLNTTIEPITNEILIDNISEDYQKLNDKIDKIISKIKNRKERKK
jgi:uncharacterized protein YaaN involved in tellurite resistance